LRFWVGFGDKWTGLAASESHLPENPLTLPHPQVDRTRFLQVMGQQLTVPEVLAITILPGRLTQCLFQPRPLRAGNARRSARALPVQQSPKPIPIEPMHPPLDRHRVLAKILGHMVTAESVADQQNPMQTVIISRFFRALNFLLQGHLHDFVIVNLQLAHNTVPALAPQEFPKPSPNVNTNMLHYL
jgi:hypothetical protein